MGQLGDMSSGLGLFAKVLGDGDEERERSSVCSVSFFCWWCGLMCLIRKRGLVRGSLLTCDNCKVEW